MDLFYATTTKYPDGHTFPARNEASQGHIRRISDNEPWRRLEEVLERHRRPDQHSRVTSYYACQSLADCALYAEAQQRDPFTGEQIDTRQIHYYRVEMPSPTAAVMQLCLRGLQHLDEPDAVGAIADEYWRPKHRWEFFEFLDGTMRIIEEVPAPTAGQVEDARFRYTSDAIQSRNIWPPARKQ